VQTVERLAQDLHQYGLRDLGQRLGFVPFLRLPVPENPRPQPITYETSREIVSRLIQGFERSNQTLTQVDGPVLLPIHLARIRIDMNGDGKASNDELLWTFYERLNRAARGESTEDLDALVV